MSAPSPDPQVLDPLMAALAAGDERRVVDLVRCFGGDLEQVVRRHVAGFGRRDVLRRSDDVQALVWTAAFVIGERAGAWRPGGAPPWVWAEQAIRSAVAAEVGHAQVPFEEAVLRGVVTAGPVPPGRAGALSPAGTPLDDLAALARRDPRLRLLVEAVARIPNQRDRHVHVAYRLQSGLGDPSPAVTVGREMGLRPDHVRQIDRRARTRLVRLALDDPHFRPLLDLAWLDPVAARSVA